MPTRISWSVDSTFVPVSEELQISARLLVHIARQPRLTPSDNGLPSLTQEGMAEALRTTPASVSHALGRLSIGGLLLHTRRHVSSRRRRVRVYQLTPDGETVAHHVLSRMAIHARIPPETGSETVVQTEST